MLDHLESGAKVLASTPAASQDCLETLRERYVDIPEEYLRLMEKASELELSIRGRYLRIWAPSGCIDQDEGYGISRRMPGAILIGDNGGGRVLFYWDGPKGHGLYSAGYGDLDPDDARWVACTLEAVLCEGHGVQDFCECDC
jgi:hypothetical protein